MKDEYIICATIWYQNDKVYRGQPTNVVSGIVICGRRHHNCRIILVEMFYPNWKDELELPFDDQPRLHVLRNEEQGFLTNTDRFVGREEGLEIALKADQVMDLTDVRGNKLHSEDLY